MRRHVNEGRPRAAFVVTKQIVLGIDHTFYLTSLIEGLDTTDYLREWLARESPVEVPAGFEGGRWLRDETFD